MNIEEDVDAMVGSLQIKMKNLKPSANKANLINAIEICKTVNEADWQGDIDAWSVFVKAIADAEAVVADINATQMMVDEMLLSLNEKMQALKPTPVTEAPETDIPVTELPATDPSGDVGEETDTPFESEPETDNDGSVIAPVETETGSILETEKGNEDEDDDDEEDLGDDLDLFDGEDPFAELGLDLGCASSVSLSALAVVGVIGTAVVIKKKKD